MKKLIISLTALVLVLICAVKYYNNDFKVNDKNPTKYYAMHDKINLDDCFSYGNFQNAGYSISLDDARLAETSDLLKELNCETDYYGESDK